MQPVIPALATAAAFATLSVLVLASEPDKPPTQPIWYSHSDHVSYFEDGRHRAEMFGLHGFDSEDEVWEELRNGQCFECHNAFEVEAEYLPRIRHCGRCHEVFLTHDLAALAEVRPCIACHGGVADGPVATLPNIERCAACHPRSQAGGINETVLALYGGNGSHTSAEDSASAALGLISNELALARYIGTETQIPWVRVYDYLPGDIVFSHERHVVLGGIDCERCHPGVREANGPLALLEELIMEDCVACHRETHAEEDCLGCHK